MTELPSGASVVIVGGGVMGASLAYHLSLRGQRDVVLLERGEVFGQGATGKCAGGVRHQFGSEINVRLSIESIRMLERFEDEPGQEIGLRQCGYLFLLTREADVEAFESNVRLQHSLGVATRWLSAAEVRRRLPLFQTDDVLAATFYGRDGLTDPSSVVAGYVSGARRRRATLLTDVEVTGFGLNPGGDRVVSVSTSRGTVEAEQVVNAAGPQAGQVGKLLGLDLPIWPLRRQMLVTTPLPAVPPDLPFVIDFAPGLYFHREGPGILTGQSNPEETPGFDERVDLEWEQRHLAAAVARMPLLEQAGLAHHWAGLYEMTPDAHPLIGRLAPLENAYVVAGFSGHGFMHGPIAGKLLAEVMLDGRATTLDISALAPDRFGSPAPSAREYNVI
ncbi:MAG TPA: FAD-binding oxidoreductase [Chloroflexota bacterium]